MKRSSLLCLSLVLSLFWTFHSAAYAQNTWAASYFLSNTDSGTGMIRQTLDGGFIVAGGIVVGSSADVWILKLDSSGTIQWQKTYGGINQDNGFWIEQTNDGGYVVVGQTLSFGASQNDVWILKLDQAGDIQWQQTLGGNGADYGLSVKQTPDDGFIVAASTFSWGPFYDEWLIRLDSFGNIVWQKRYGGLGDSFAYSVNLTSDGGFIVSGYTSVFADHNYDLWVLKFDSAGAIQWQKTYGGADDEYSSFGIKETFDGGFILTGASVIEQTGSSDIIVLKLNSNGQIQWQNSYGGADSEWAASIEQTIDGGYILAGQNGQVGTGAYWLLKLNSIGDIEWQKAYQGDDFQRLASMSQTSDGGFILSGSDVLVSNHGGGWILKVDDNGEIDPSCPFVSDTNVISVPLSFVELNSAATVTDTTVVPVATTASVNLGAGEYLQQCVNQCVFCDSFGDGVLATDWTYSKPSWNEAGGNLIGSPVKRKTQAIATPAFAGCDLCSVQATMKSSGGPGNSVSLFTHYVDNKTNVEVILKEEADKVVLKQRINGIVVVKGKSSIIIDPNTPYNVVLSYDGSLLSLSINGTNLITVPSVGTLPSATVGFKTINTTALFDDIRVD